MLEKIARRIAAERGDRSWEQSTWEDHAVQDPKVAELEPNEIVDDIEIYGAWEVSEAIFGENQWEKMIPYQEKMKAYEIWADAHNAIIYMEPREDFDLREAAGQAAEQGKKAALVDDLS
jgi:hypothetical protein